jgi:hypothetical protein
MAESRVRDELDKSKQYGREGFDFRLRVDEHIDAIVDAFARVLDAVNAIEPPPTTDELWQRNVGRVLGDRGRSRGNRPRAGIFSSHDQTNSRERKGYEVVLRELDESLLRVLLAAHDPRLREQLNKQDRILIQDGAEIWLRSLDWHDVYEQGHAVVDPHPYFLPDPWGDTSPPPRRLFQVPWEEAKAELEGPRRKKPRGWWRRPCRDHKIKGCSQCIRKKRGRPKKQGTTDPAESFNRLAHAAGYGPDVFKRPAKGGRPSHAQTERLDLLAEAVRVMHAEGHSDETIGGVIGGGRQRANELRRRNKRAA